MASHAAREARRNFKIRYGIVRAQGPGPQWPLLCPINPASAGDCYESTLTVQGVQSTCLVYCYFYFVYCICLVR